MTFDPNLSSPARPKYPETKVLATSLSTDSSSTPSSGPLNASDVPRVEQALNFVLEHRNDPYVEPRETLSTVREEADSLPYRASDEVRFQIRKNPWQSVGIAGFAGFLFGITR